MGLLSRGGFDKRREAEAASLVCDGCPQKPIADKIAAALHSKNAKERKAAQVALDIVRLSGCKAPFDPVQGGTIFEDKGDMLADYRRRTLLEGTALHPPGTDLYPTEQPRGPSFSLQEAAAPSCHNLYIETAEKVLQIAQGIIDLQENWGAGQGL